MYQHSPRIPEPVAADVRRVVLIQQGWWVLLILAAVAQVAIGVLMLIAGKDGFESRIFDAAEIVPWWGWGVWSIAGGLLMPWRGWLRNVGVTSSVAWYGLWWALLTVGILNQPAHHFGPKFSMYPIAIYGFLTGIHVLMWAIEFLSVNPWTDRRPQGGS